jgi:hypothetical protein
MFGRGRLSLTPRAMKFAIKCSELCFQQLAIGADARISATDYPNETIDRFMDEATRRALTALLVPGSTLRLNGPRFELVRPWRARRLEVAVMGLRIALRLLARAARTLATVEGMEFVEESVGLCGVCACPLDADVVSCLTCAASHHAECWEYAGVCSTYGCGQRRFTKP